MAFGKHIRQEKQSSSLFFKGTVVIFVGFCVLAVWMMNSSSPMPEETKRFSSIPQAKSEIREKIIDSVSFEDNPGDLHVFFEVGVAIYQKPTSNTCYESRRKNEPPMCDEADDPNAAWYVPMGSCLHKVPNVDDERGTEWPEEWPQRLEKVPDWLSNDVHTSFMSDTEHWKRIITKSYLTGFGIDWSNVRNVMDMKTVYGGYVEAIRAFNQVLLYIVKTKQFHQKSPQFDQILKKNEQMYALLAICLSLCPQVKLVEENVNNQLREKYGEKMLRMQRSDEALYDELFSYACPKFITPSAPNYDEPPVNYNQFEEIINDLDRVKLD